MSSLKQKALDTKKGDNRDDNAKKSYLIMKSFGKIAKFHNRPDYKRIREKIHNIKGKQEIVRHMKKTGFEKLIKGEKVNTHEVHKFFNN